MDVEWIILADAAEVLNNKLYLMGGGWETLTINSALPIQHQCAVATSFLVPWDETDRRHDVEVFVRGPEGEELVRLNAQIEVGRPAGIPHGHAQRVQMALQLALPLRSLGSHAVSVAIAGREALRVYFGVLAGPQFPEFPASQT